MITIKIANIAETKGIKKAHELQKALDCSPTTASKLWKGNFKQIGIETIDRLCELLECEPSDLLSFVSQKPKAEKPAREPQPIKKTGTDNTMLTTIEVAKRLGVSRRTVNDYINQAKLRATKGKQNHQFVSESDFEEFCRNRI